MVARAVGFSAVRASRIHHSAIFFPAAGGAGPKRTMRRFCSSTRETCAAQLLGGSSPSCCAAGCAPAAALLLLLPDMILCCHHQQATADGPTAGSPAIALIATDAQSSSWSASSAPSASACAAVREVVSSCCGRRFPEPGRWRFQRLRRSLACQWLACHWAASHLLPRASPRALSASASLIEILALAASVTEASRRQASKNCIMSCRPG